MKDQPVHYPRIMRAVAETPWAITHEGFATIIEILAVHASGVKFTEEELRERLEAAGAQPRRQQTAGPPAVAVIPLVGPIFPRANLMTDLSGATSLQVFRSQLREAVNNPDITGVVLDVHSPGGSTYGVAEAAAEIRQARDVKPLVAVANQLCASAAYHIASQASELVASPSALVGSIGVFAAHDDISKAMEMGGIKTTLVSAGKHKVEGNPFEPLTAEARAALQELVDDAYKMFVKDVAKGRGVSVDTVRRGFGEGRVVPAGAALEQGMADRVDTLENTIHRLLSGRTPRPAGANAQHETRVYDSSDLAGISPTPRLWTPEAAPAGRLWTPEGGMQASGTVGGGTGSVTVTGGTVRPLAATTPDRRGEMEPDETTPDAPQADEASQAAAPANPDPAPAATATAEPAPRQNSEQFDELARVQRQHAEAVQDLKAGKADQEKVDRLAEQLLELQKNMPKSGYQPGDENDGYGAPPSRLRALRGLERVAAVHDMPAALAAAELGRPVEDLREFHRVANNTLLLGRILGVNPRETGYYSQEFLPRLHAAMDTATSNEGSQFVPTVLSAELIERVNLQLRVAALFPDLPMPQSPWELPGMGVSRVRGGKHAEQTADTAQTKIKKITPATRKVTLTAQKLAAEVLISKELEEDSIIPMLDFIQNELTDYLAADLEDAIVNGDDAGSHQDADVTDADDPRKIWDGLRILTQATEKTSASNAALTVAMLRVNRKVMGKYAVNPDRLAHVVGIAGYNQLLNDTSVLTLDKYGPGATILSGELGKVDNIPLIVSEYIRQDLNASGVYDGSTTNRSVALTVSRSSFTLGTRRGVTIEVLRELYSESDQDAIKITQRKAWSPLFPTSQPIVSLTYNLAI